MAGAGLPLLLSSRPLLSGSLETASEGSWAQAGHESRGRRHAGDVSFAFTRKRAQVTSPVRSACHRSGGRNHTRRRGGSPRRPGGWELGPQGLAVPSRARAALSASDGHLLTVLTCGGQEREGRSAPWCLFTGGR